ncbi:uncharacterized protein METZ01_LOCUS360483, partial [marine metagenome]
KTAFGLRTTDLRNIAIGLAAAILLVMVAGQMSDSGSASASSLEETSEKRFTCTFTSSATQSPNEDQDDVVTLTYTASGGGNTCSFAITGGADAADFSLSGVDLDFAATADYENPVDADTNNAYVVEITATDSADSATTVQTMTATVQDLTLAITSGQSANVAENTAADAEVLNTATTDSPTACAITLGNTDDDDDDNDAFAVDADCGVKVNDAGDLDFEGDGYTSSWTLTLLATNGLSNEQAVQTVTFTLTDANDNAPVFSDGDTDAVAVNEGGTTVGDYDLTDADSTDAVNTCTDGSTDAADFTPTKVSGT